MKYRVEIQRPARIDAGKVYLYLWEQSPQAAERWLDGFHRAAASLHLMPARCGHAPEGVDFPGGIRQLLYGQYRILFTISGRTVRIVHVQHSAQAPLET